MGVGHPEPGEDRGFQPFHRLRLVVGDVIVADEMKKAMHREMRQVMRERLALGAGFPLGGLVGDHDVAKKTRCCARADEPAFGECPARALVELPRWPLASLASAARAVRFRGSE